MRVRVSSFVPSWHAVGYPVGDCRTSPFQALFRRSPPLARRATRICRRAHLSEPDHGGANTIGTPVQNLGSRRGGPHALVLGNLTNCANDMAAFQKVRPENTATSGSLCQARFRDCKEMRSTSFVRLRQAATQIAELDRRLRPAERRIGQHDEHLAGIVRKLRELTASPPSPAKPVRRIGFIKSEEDV